MDPLLWPALPGAGNRTCPVPGAGAASTRGNAPGVGSWEPVRGVLVRRAVESDLPEPEARPHRPVTRRTILERTGGPLMVGVGVLPGPA